MFFKGKVAIVSVSIALAYGHAIAAVTPATKPASRIPPAAKIAEADKLIDDLYKKELAGKSTTARIAAGRLLLKTAIETQDDPAGKYALFQRAQSLAAETGDVKTLMDAIDEMATAFNLDGPALESAAIRKVAKSLSETESQKLLAGYALTAVQAMLNAERYDEAEPLGPILRTASAASGDPQLQTRGTEWATFDQWACSEHKRLKPLFDALAIHPDDAAADTAIGQFLCVCRGDWRSGLPLLAKGVTTKPDSVWRSLAVKDLAFPIDAKEQAELAAGWWELAELQPEPGKGRIRTHAIAWYRRALPNLEGLDRALAEKRTAGATEDPMPTATTAPQFTLLNTAGVAEGPGILDTVFTEHPDYLKDVQQVELLAVHDAKKFAHHHGDFVTVTGAAADPAGVSRAGGMWLFGVYEKHGPGKYLFVYRVQLQAVPDDSELAFFDVCLGGSTISGLHLKASSLPANQWATVTVPLNLHSTETTEIRLWSTDHPMALDRVYVFQMK